ncbi:MAG: hypothetical protein KA715_04015 [Xanthomonadaceae bacterium]|nr:hypothetical protein [Xanthomonadaceae bacterium]
MNRVRAWIALGTSVFFESARDRVFYVSFLIAINLQFLNLLLSRLTFVRPERVVVDVGATAIVWVGLGLSVLLGAGMIPNEMEKKTAILVLTKKITRVDFILSKSVGLAGILMLNQLILGAVWWLMLEQVKSPFNTVNFQFLWLCFLMSWICGLFAILISSFSSRTVSVLLGLGFYLIGINLSLLREFFPGPGSKFLSQIFFDFEKFHLGLNLSYGVALDHQVVLSASVYAVCWAAALSLLAAVVMKKRW